MKSDDGELLAMLGVRLIDIDQFGKLSHAGTAPVPPEIDEHPFALEVGDRDFLGDATGFFHRPERRRFADVFGNFGRCQVDCAEVGLSTSAGTSISRRTA